MDTFMRGKYPPLSNYETQGGLRKKGGEGGRDKTKWIGEKDR